MPLMELHKHEGGVVELVSDPPDIHVWSAPYVDRETKAGWLAFAGSPVKYEVTPDPNGQMATASKLTLTLPGDRLVMHVVKDGKPAEFVYRITHYPVPQFFRLADDREPDGIRAANEYGVELVTDGG